MPVREWMRDRRVAGALAAVAVVVVGYRLVKSVGVPPPPPPAPGALSSPAPGPTESTLSPSVSPLPVQASPAPFPPGWSGPSWNWGRNPFLGPSPEPLGAKLRHGGALPSAAREEGSLPELRGTVVSGNEGLAIFGKRLVPVGGAVGDWTLSGVEPYRVSLRRGKETRVLELYKQ